MRAGGARSAATIAGDQPQGSHVLDVVDSVKSEEASGMDLAVDILQMAISEEKEGEEDDEGGDQIHQAAGTNLISNGNNLNGQGNLLSKFLSSCCFRGGLSPRNGPKGTDDKRIQHNQSKVEDDTM